MSGNSANKRGGDGNADGGRGEIMNCQAYHLREVRYRAFTAIALPIGVGGKTHRGVERKARTQCGQALQVHRQDVLQAENAVGK